MSFGHDLRQEREQRGISLEEIAATTRVSTRFLRALESDTYADLPGGIFNRSMVRGYCTHLGLDPAPWLEHFRTQHVAEPAERDWAAFAENVRRTRAPTGAPPIRWWGVAVLIAVLLAGTWAAWNFVIKRRVLHPQPHRNVLMHTRPGPTPLSTAS